MLLNALCMVFVFLWCRALVAHGGQASYARVLVQRRHAVVRYCIMRSADGRYGRLEWVMV